MNIHDPIPIDVLEYARERRALAEVERFIHEGITFEQLRLVDGGWRADAYHWIIANAPLPAALLTSLALSKCSLDRECVGASLHSAQETLELLASDAVAAVRHAVASNPRASSRLLWRLAQDQDPGVRCQAQSTRCGRAAVRAARCDD